MQTAAAPVSPAGTGSAHGAAKAPILLLVSPGELAQGLPRAKGRTWQLEEPARPVSDRNQPAPEMAPPGGAVSGQS